MNPLDREARAGRYLDAMTAFEEMLAGQAPGLPMATHQIAQLLGLLNDEARKVIPRYTPGERAPGLRAINDEEDDE